FVMTFFSFSTTQEYYSLPIYPAFALLLGAAMVSDSLWIRRGTKAVGLLAASLVLLIAGIVWKVWSLPTPGDISSALVQHPELYTLSLGHMGDLTMKSFAYLRVPLMLEEVAVLIGAFGIARYWNKPRRSFFAMAAMMVVFFHAARLAMIAFDPYLSSKPLANALAAAPPGKLIEADAYYAFSSVFFYTNRTALLWNGRVDNLEYGSNAPDAPDVFIDDAKFQQQWCGPERYYLLADAKDLPRVE